MAVSTKISLDNNKVVQSSGKILTLSGNTLIASSGTLKYLTDTSSTYDARSVTDAGFVTGLTSAISSNLSSNYYTKTVINNYTGATDTRIGDIESDVAISLTGASNGLTKVGNHDVKLGGVITESTIITDNRGTPVGIQYGGDYSANYTPRSLVDAGYVTGKTNAISINLANNYYDKTQINYYTGTTLPNNYYNKTEINQYTGSTDNRITLLESNSAKALTGATNGLTSSASRLVCLGGTLNTNTTIDGAHCLKLGDLNSICLSTQNTTDIALNAKSNGAIYLKSQSGTIESSNDSTNAVLFSMDYNASPAMLIIDNTPSPHGLVYAGDYSQTFCPHSLVDKQYVDSVATGLNVHGAVAVATTSEITLSGLSQTIDGVTPTVGMRILVKDQSNQTTNGIYSASTGIWGRTSDYNFAPTGEVGNGDIIPVLSGNTNANSQWILISPNPIISGTTDLVFSKFSQQQGIIDGNGISVTTVGTNRQIDVKLSSTNSGLCFDSTALELDYSIFRYGLTCSQTVGKVDVKTEYCSATGLEIPVALNTGNTSCKLYVDSCTIKTCLNPVIDVNNGLTKVGCTVSLGGTLTGDTTISGNAGAYDLNINNLDSFNLGFSNVSTITDNGTNGGLRYAADYSSMFVNRSIPDVEYVNVRTQNAITGATNGLIKCDNHTVMLGGQICGQKTIDLADGSFLRITCGYLNCGGYLHVAGWNTLPQVSWAGIGYSNPHNNTEGAIQADRFGFGNDSMVRLYARSGDTSLLQKVVYLSYCNALMYDVDYSADFVDRSLVDKGYVDNAIIASVVIAENGLTKSGYTITLGGVLNQNTTISGNSSYSLTIDKPNEFNVVCSSTIEMSSPSIIFSNYCDNTTNGSVVWLDYCGLTLSHEGSIDPSGNTTSSIFLGRNDLGNRDIVISSSNGGITIEASKYLDINTSGVTIQTTPQTYSLTNPNVLVWDNNDKLIKITCGDALGDKNNKYDVCVVNSNTTLTLTGDTYVVMVDTSSQPISLTLSSNGLVSGRTVKIKDGSGNALSNNITITSPTLSFDGGDDAVINTDFGALELIYTEGVGACGWKVLSFYN